MALVLRIIISNFCSPKKKIGRGPKMLFIVVKNATTYVEFLRSDEFRKELWNRGKNHFYGTIFL